VGKESFASQQEGVIKGNLSKPEEKGGNGGGYFHEDRFPEVLIKLLMKDQLSTGGAQIRGQRDAPEIPPNKGQLAERITREYRRFKRQRKKTIKLS